MPGVKAHKHPPRKQKKRPPGSRVKDPVNVAPIREAVLEVIRSGQMDYSEIATRAGLVNPRNGKPDTSRLQRRLGLRPEVPSRKNGRVYGAGPPHGLINYDVAVAIVRAINGWPVEFNL